MPKGNLSGGVGETLHAVGVRYRVTGSGTLKSTLQSLDEVRTSDLQGITMATPNDIEPTILANFESQRIQLYFYTDQIDDEFLITRINLFIKPVAQTLPIGV